MGYDSAPKSFGYNPNNLTLSETGNIRVDRASTGVADTTRKVLTYASCMVDLGSVVKSCGGYGGWVATDYGTVSILLHNPMMVERRLLNISRLLWNALGTSVREIWYREPSLNTYGDGISVLKMSSIPGTGPRSSQRRLTSLSSKI